MDFNLLMFLLLVLTGAVWLLDIAFLRRSRPAGRTEPWPVEWSRSFFPVILIVFLIRSFVVEPFRIPSGSMIPTLLVNDFLLVNKFAYGVRLPLVNTELFPVGKVQRGDVIVFRYPLDPSVNYIKRVVGLPGDKISYVNKQLIINGKPVPLQYLGDYSYVRDEGYIQNAQEYREVLGKHVHDILIQPDQNELSNFPTITVPPGHYFAMGDNRDDSSDSRVWGFVPDRNLEGKAMFIWWSWNNQSNSVRWKRIGEWIP